MTTYLNFVVDESGSMADKAGEVISGFANYIEGLKDAKDIRLSLTQFALNARVIYTNQKLEDIPPFDEKTYQPNGFTALYDAVARTILEVEKKMSKKDKSLVVILTDGQENSSEEYKDVNVIKEMITSREKSGKWTFVYLGIGLDKWDVNIASASMGVSAGNTSSYGNSAVAMRSVTKAAVYYTNSDSGNVSNLMEDVDSSV